MNARASRRGVLVAAALGALGCKRAPRAERSADRGGAADGGAADAGTFDAAAHRERARVPAVAYAAFTRAGLVVDGASGFADAPAKRVVTRDAPFLAASIAKTIVATCAMQLVEQGRADLDLDVTRYVGFPVRHPRFPDAPVRLRALLVHDACIRDDFARLHEASSADAARVELGPFLRAYLARAEAWLPTRPGTSYAYSNVGAALAAYAVERISGASFADASARAVFAPLAMRRTTWAPCPDPERAAPHALRDGVFARADRSPYAVYPAVDLWASAQDLARFGRAILRGGELDGARILSAASVDLMLREARPDQALGWQIRTIGGARVVGHEGEDEGASTGLYVDRARGVGAVVLANGDAFASGERARAEALERVLVELLARAAVAPR